MAGSRHDDPQVLSCGRQPGAGLAWRYIRGIGCSPRLAAGLTDGRFRQARLGHQALTILPVVGFVLVAIAMAYAIIDVPSTGNARLPQSRFLNYSANFHCSLRLSFWRHGGLCSATFTAVNHLKPGSGCLNLSLFPSRATCLVAFLLGSPSFIPQAKQAVGPVALSIRSCDSVQVLLRPRSPAFAFGQWRCVCFCPSETDSY